MDSVSQQSSSSSSSSSLQQMPQLGHHITAANTSATTINNNTALAQQYVPQPQSFVGLIPQQHHHHQPMVQHQQPPPSQMLPLPSPPQQQQPQQQHQPQQLSNANNQYQAAPMPTTAFPVPLTQQSAYITSLINQSQVGLGGALGSNGGKIKVRAMDMTKPDKSFDEVFAAKRKEELAADLERVKQMTLLDDDNVLFTLTMKSPAFTNKLFYLKLLSMMYREKYADLFEKYRSLSVYLEFALAVIIYANEAEFKNACASRTVKVPTSYHSSTSSLSKLFRSCKRNSAIKLSAITGGDKTNGEAAGNSSSGNSSGDDDSNAVTAKTSSSSTPVAKRRKITTPHPFLNTHWYKTQSILYDIGRCCDISVPSEFAELYAYLQFGQISKLNANSKDTYDGLRITFSKPIVCLVVPRTVSNYVFLSLEHLTTFGRLLEELTTLSTLEDTFACGVKVKMTLVNIETRSVTEAKDYKFESGFNMVVVNSMQVCKLSNNTLSSKTYADVVYVLHAHELTAKEEADCLEYIERSADQMEAIIDEYDKEIGII